MNLRDLQYLVAVAEHGAFGKAAEACFVSQPALSMQLQKLEETLGVQLFERTNRSVMITEVGAAIVERAQRILRDVEEMKDVATSYHDPFAGELRIGAFPTLAPYYFPELVPEVSESFPKLQLLLIEEKTETLLKQLKEGKLDVALIALPVDDDVFESKALFDDSFLLAVSADHPLTERAFITQADLQGEDLLLLDEGHCLRDQALDVCSTIGVGEQQNFRATSLETLRQMVLTGVGITLIPKIAMREDDGLVYIPFSKNPPSRTIGLVWRKTSARKELIEALLEELT